MSDSIGTGERGGDTMDYPWDQGLLHMMRPSLMLDHSKGATYG